MMIVVLSQQLGNQMFQYALGKQLEMLGREVKYEVSYFGRHPEHKLTLPRIFNLQIPVATQAEVESVWAARRRFFYRVMKKVFGRDPLRISELSEECFPRPFNRRVFASDRGVLNGYWQSEKYFSGIADLIRQVYTFPEASLRNRELAEEMASCTSVSIHVRRGDYQGLFPFLTQDYYCRAMDFFNEKYGEVHFYVFSNDLEWCREHVKAERITYVDWNTGADSHFDMWLMTQCKHNIIANSTFSWWGAWLNGHEGKEVIAPRTWDFYFKDHPDLYVPEWILF